MEGDKNQNCLQAFSFLLSVTALLQASAIGCEIWTELFISPVEGRPTHMPLRVCVYVGLNENKLLKVINTG